MQHFAICQIVYHVITCNYQYVYIYTVYMFCIYIYNKYVMASCFMGGGGGLLHILAFT